MRSLIKTIKHFDMFMNHHHFIDETQDSFFCQESHRSSRWREMRSILSPTFTSSETENMFKLMSDCSIDFSNHLAQLSPKNRIIKMKDIVTKYTNNVIATYSFGVSVDSIRNPKKEFYAKNYNAKKDCFFLTVFF